MRSAQETSTPAGKTRRRASYANGERTRSALVAAAFDVFAQKGFQRLSLRQIAEEIGTSHTALLHHFGSKDALLNAVLERREELEGPERAELLSRRGLLDAVPEVMRRNAEQPGVIQLDSVLRVEAMQPDHAAHDFVAKREADFVASVRTELEAEQRAGRLRAGLDLDKVARMITSLIEGIQLAWLSDDTVDMAAHLEAFLDLIRAPDAS
jgi:AcrR family transcriptional regulator